MTVPVLDLLRDTFDWTCAGGGMREFELLVPRPQPAHYSAAREYQPISGAKSPAAGKEASRAY